MSQRHIETRSDDTPRPHDQRLGLLILLLMIAVVSPKTARAVDVRNLDTAIDTARTGVSTSCHGK